MKYFKNTIDFLSKFICEFIVVICLILTFYQQVNDNKWKEIIRSDGLGYYAYLPAVFIYHDYKFDFLKKIDDNYHTSQYPDSFLRHVAGGKVDKYYVGLSIIWLPFFLLAHLLTLLTGGAPDGYSFYYQILLGIAGLFYLWLGCKYTLKLISQYSLSRNAAAFIILLMVFGTHLSHYTTCDSNGTHIYSFAVIAVFLFKVHSFFKNKNYKDLYWATFLLGLIFLLRPPNILVALFFPFFAGSLSSFWQTLKSIKKEIFICVGIFIITISPQFILYFLQIHHIFLWAYTDETFNFKNPQFMNVLLSYRKGLFVYAPLLLLSILGLFYLLKKNKFQFLILVFFLFMSTYIISSWWCWYYGSCLGQRSFVDYSAITALLLTFLLLSLKNIFTRILFYSVTPLFIIYSFVLSYQYRHFIIHWDAMDKNRFWAVFMKTDEQYEGLVFSKGLFSGKEPYQPVSIKASNNNYLCAEYGDAKEILVNRNTTKAWETFNLINLDNNKVAFKSDNGKFVSARLNEANQIKYTGETVREWETFEMIKLGDKRFALKAFNNKFVRLKENKLFADADCLSGSECFFTLGYK